MRKPAFCICENNDADQLHGNREADLLISAFVFATQIVQFFNFLNFKPSSVAKQPGFCGTWSEIPKTGWLI